MKDLPRAKSIDDDLMDVVDRLGFEYDKVDPRSWDHFVIYIPKSKREAMAQDTVTFKSQLVLLKKLQDAAFGVITSAGMAEATQAVKVLNTTFYEVEKYLNERVGA